MAQSISPFFRSPFTDITGGIVSHQLLDRCAQQEMAVMDCLEAYGLDRGLKKCKPLIEDFQECQTSCKQYKRFLAETDNVDQFKAIVTNMHVQLSYNVAMREERDRQIAAGKLCHDKKYVSPRIDSY